MDLRRAVLVLVYATLSSAVRNLSGGAPNCPRQDINCTARQSNCMDPGWLKVNDYTPSGPEELQVSVDTRRDDRGQLQPVLHANWKIKDDGSIRYLKATEVHVVVMSNNQNVCIRYTFKNILQMRSPSGEKWSFSSDTLVLDPGYIYKVSVFNIPKPEIYHSDYNVSAIVRVPDCINPKMQMTQFCIERGSLWKPNISLAQSADSLLAVSFNPDTLCEKYLVIVRCGSSSENRIVDKTNGTLTVTFSLDLWPLSCCQFDAEIKPYFPQCYSDCPRQRRTLNICKSIEEKESPDSLYTFLALGTVFVCMIMAVSMCVFCRKQGKPVIASVTGIEEKLWQQPLKQPPNVLVIYSQDHHLYRDVVLKLCAFLQAKCGTKVLVDLLDSTSVSMVGRLRWLEWQRQQLKNPSDKILVLCSRGVQAKWRALCGQGQVKLREDILSPTDDMLIPFLNMFLPDLHQAGMLGKYMVAYFEDISSEKDVPSVFDIAVKYNLMKNFEELYFRILDIEKYQPGKVNHIEGIGRDEYFNCPSGRALKNAIETFQAFQLENPNWFEKECVVSEEEVVTEADQLTDQLQIPPVLECIPPIRDGPPIYICDVPISKNCNSVHILTPEVNPEHRLPSVAELLPVVNPDYEHQFSSCQVEVLTDHLLHPYSQTPESAFIAEPVWNNQPLPGQNWLSLREEPLAQMPAEDDEEDSLLPMSHLSAHSDEQCFAPKNSLVSRLSDFPCQVRQSMYFPSSEMSPSQPEEVEEKEDLEPSGKDPSSGSDQGYISKMSSQPEAADPKVALARFQEWLFQRNLGHYDMDPEEN
ncbi:interleukin 17 receptor A1a isoform X2 [Leuresthes tenuis]|uniref:interleukin 17 receptor A1a isoform X2 n=1 Tax=Leuresthes tenuis TaxID=355514 RepID=UPI003B508306